MPARAKKQPKICPHLGLAEDPFARADTSSEAHRCYAYMQRERIDAAHQKAFCLTDAHKRCPFLQVKPVRNRRTRMPRPRVPGTVRRGAAAAVVWMVGGLRATRRRGRAAGEALGHGLRSAASGARGATRNGLGRLGRSAGSGAAGARLGLRRSGLAAALLLVRLAGLLLAVAIAAAVWAWHRQCGLRRVRRIVRAALSVLVGGARLAGGVAVWPIHTAARALAAARVTLPFARGGAERADGPPRVTTSEVAVRARTHEVAVAPVPGSVPLAGPAWREPLAGNAAAPPLEPAGPGLLGRYAAVEADLLERGVMLVEAGREEEAYALFRHAAERNPRAERAWFWRAKTASTLAEVIDCLEKALALNPENEKVRMNLEWARLRHEREALTALTAGLGPSPEAREAVRSARQWRPSPVVRLRVAALGVTRAMGATAALLLGLAWIAGGLPEPVRLTLLSGARLDARLLEAVPLVDVARLPAAGSARIEVLSGYDPLSALPFVLGFLALLVASGLLHRERWTRWWGPVLALASAGVWMAAVGSTPPSTALALCGLVALGGLASSHYAMGERGWG